MQRRSLCSMENSQLSILLKILSDELSRPDYLCCTRMIKNLKIQKVSRD